MYICLSVCVCCIQVSEFYLLHFITWVFMCTVLCVSVCVTMCVCVCVCVCVCFSMMMLMAVDESLDNNTLPKEGWWPLKCNQITFATIHHPPTQFCMIPDAMQKCSDRFSLKPFSMHNPLRACIME